MPFSGKSTLSGFVSSSCGPSRLAGRSTSGRGLALARCFADLRGFGMPNAIVRFCAISSIVRPVSALSGLLIHDLAVGLRPASSSDLNSSQLLPSSESLARVRTRCQRPRSFSPSKAKTSAALHGRRAADRPPRLQVPRSHTMTVPPPYSPSWYRALEAAVSTG